MAWPRSGSVASSRRSSEAKLRSEGEPGSSYRAELPAHLSEVLSFLVSNPQS